MTMYTPIVPVSFDERPEEVAYRQAVAIHCPGCDELEMAARCDVAVIRDQATLGIPKATDSAAVILGEVVKLATFSVYAPCSASELIRTKSVLHLGMMAARGFERLQRRA